MLDLNLTEKQFEDDIEYSLLTYGGYTKGDAKVFDRTVALDVSTLISFVKATQLKSWEKYGCTPPCQDSLPANAAAVPTPA